LNTEIEIQGGHDMKAIEKILVVAGLLLLFVGSGCDEQASSSYSDKKVVATLGSGLILRGVAQNDATLYYLKADLKNPTFDEILRAKKTNIRWVVPGQGEAGFGKIFVLLTPIDPRDPSQSTRLVSLHPDSSEVISYELAMEFGSIRFSQEGRVAVLANLEGDQASGFYNPGEIAILDLDKGPGSENPTRITLDTKGRSLRDVMFLEPFVVGGAQRRLAAVTLRGALKLLDLDTPSAPMPIVPLSAGADLSGDSVRQIEVAGEAEGRSAMLLVRTARSQDILAVTLWASEEGLGASLNQLGVGGYPLGITLRTDETTGKVHAVVLAQKGNLAHVAVVDVDTSERFDIELLDPADRLVPLADGDVAMFGAQGTRVHFLSLAQVLSLRESALTELKLHAKIESIHAIDKMRFIFTDISSAEALLVNLEERKATRLYLGQWSHDWSGGAVYEDTVFLLLPDRQTVGLVDLSANAPSSLLLDDWVQGLYLLKDKGIGLAWHGDVAWGRVTMFPLDDPRREAARVFDGFLMSGALD
jgi:hypothetical protein